MGRKILIHPQWKGFEFHPHGALSEQHIDLRAETGFAYERSIDFHKDFHTHDRLMLVFPRPGSRMKVRTKNPEGLFRIREGDALMVPEGVVHDDEGASAVYDTIALFPSNGMLERALAKVEVSRKSSKSPLGQARKFRRTPEISTQLDALFLESVFLKGRSSAETRSLAESLLDACMRELLPTERSRARLADSRNREPDPDPINRAISHLEIHLFAPINLGTLARVAGLSTSTLLRHFRKRTGLTPVSYLVGYRNLGAFSEAFKRKFGRPPSVFTR